MKRHVLPVALIALVFVACGTVRSLANADLLHISELTPSDETEAEVAPAAASSDDFIVCSMRVEGPGIPTAWQWRNVPISGQTLREHLKESGALPSGLTFETPDGIQTIYTMPPNGECHQLNVAVTRAPVGDSDWQSLRFRMEFDAELTIEFSVSRETLKATQSLAAMEEAIALGEERVYAEFATRRCEYNTAKTLAENARH